jgi:hypothetical protein
MNAARGAHTRFEHSNDLSKLDFEGIYHRQPNPNDRVIGARCAEVLVQDELPLDGFLSCVVCRSKAEKETLLNMLTPNQRMAYNRRILVGEELFNRMWHFVDDVVLTKGGMLFRYANPPKDDVFEYKYELSSVEWQPNFVQKHPQLAWEFEHALEGYEIRLSIDDHIAYLGRFRDPSNPFYF